MLIKKSDVDSKVIEDIIRVVDERLGITGLTGVQMKDKIADIERAADQLGLVGAQRTVFIKNEMIARGLQKEGKLKAGPTRTALRKKMILEELNKRCGVTSGQIQVP